MLTASENARRLELHSQGLTDAEMAAAIGISYGSAYDWRKSRKLPANSKNYRYWDELQHSVPMEEALTPDQCGRMRAFLGGMVSLANRFPDRKLDVGEYMKGYREAGLWGERTATAGTV